MRFDHVGITVADLPAAADWYANALGLRREFEGRVEAIDLDIVMLVDDEQRYRVELLHRPGAQPAERPRNPAEAALSPGFSHAALDVTDLDATHARLVSLGAVEVMAPQQSPEAGVRMSYLTDPEGNLLELVSRHPG